MLARTELSKLAPMADAILRIIWSCMLRLPSCATTTSRWLPPIDMFARESMNDMRFACSASGILCKLRSTDLRKVNDPPQDR